MKFPNMRGMTFDYTVIIGHNTYICEYVLDKYISMVIRGEQSTTVITIGFHGLLVKDKVNGIIVL